MAAALLTRASMSNVTASSPASYKVGHVGHGVPWLHCMRSNARRAGLVCRAEIKKDERIEESRKFQLQATEVLAEILKSKDKDGTAERYVDGLTQEFFHIASAYLSMAKKEANVEVVGQIEAALKAAMTAKNKTLRPEIRLFNKLLSDNSSAERQETIRANYEYLQEDSYFFELLNTMTKDVENQKETDERAKLLNQLRIISKQTRDVAKALKKSKS